MTARPVSGSVQATLCLNTGDDSCTDEGELFANPEAYRSAVQANRRLSGAIKIDTPGQPTIEYEDELGPAVQDLCFRSIPDLLEGKPVELTIFSYPGTVRLVPDNQQVLISGDVVDSASLPLGELCEALFACGRRFIDLARRFRGDAYEHILRPLEEYGRAAEAALRQHGLAA